MTLNSYNLSSIILFLSCLSSSLFLNLSSFLSLSILSWRSRIKSTSSLSLPPRVSCNSDYFWLRSYTKASEFFSTNSCSKELIISDTHFEFLNIWVVFGTILITKFFLLRIDLLFRLLVWTRVETLLFGKINCAGYLN